MINKILRCTAISIKAFTTSWMITLNLGIILDFLLVALNEKPISCRFSIWVIPLIHLWSLQVLEFLGLYFTVYCSATCYGGNGRGYLKIYYGRKFPFLKFILRKFIFLLKPKKFILPSVYYATESLSGTITLLHALESKDLLIKVIF